MKDIRLYIIHIQECIQRIEEYTSEGRAYFMSDQKTRDAVLRNFEVMGEAAKRVPQSIRDKYPAIPWRRIAGFRDVLIHQYEGVDAGEVWEVIEKEMPLIKKQIASVLIELDSPDVKT